MKWLESITNSMDMNLSKLWEIVEDRQGVEQDFSDSTITRDTKTLDFFSSKILNIKQANYENTFKVI